MSFVGGGIAGLVVGAPSARPRSVALEAANCVGGRTGSQQRGDLAPGVGAHMFPPPTRWSKLVGELGLRGHADHGRCSTSTSAAAWCATCAELLPLRLPLAAGRVSFARAGLKVKRDADEYMKLLTRGPGETMRTSGCARSSTAVTRHSRLPRKPAPRRVPHLRGALEPLARRSRRDLAVGHVGALRARLGLRRSRPQHARRLGLLPDALGASLDRSSVSARP